MEVKSNPRGKAGIDDSELNKFRDQMLEAVKNSKELYETTSKANNPEVEQAKTSAIEIIERELKKKNLKVEDLEERYRNYQEQINSLDKVWRIRSLRDKITTFIRRQKVNYNKNRDVKINELGDKAGEQEDRGGEKVGGQQPRSNQNNSQGKNKFPEKQDTDGGIYQPNETSVESEFDSWDSLSKEELIDEIKKSRSDNNRLQKIIISLETRIKELEEEIAELKAEKAKTSEVSEQQEISQEIRQKELKLQELRKSLMEVNGKSDGSPSSQSANNFPTSLLVVGA
ncbi:7614_t:CDS:1, partial [Paraglomus brasilianum]